MRAPKGIPTHFCCPAEWKGVPNITGSFELDGAIARNRNKDMLSRLAMYAGLSASRPINESYGPRTNYDGYDGYSGDE
jgi:hypothetical protein